MTPISSRFTRWLAALGCVAALSVAAGASSPAAAAAAADADRGEYASSLVKINVTVRTPDFDTPWKHQKTVTQEYMGTVVEGGRVLVTARAVAYATLILMSRVGDASKVPMRVVQADYGANLAVLAAEDPKAMEGLEPVALANELSPEDTVTIHSGGNRQRLVPLNAFVKDYGFRQSGTSSYVIPFYYLEVRQTSGLGWAEPALKGGKLAAMTAGQSGNTVFAIPARVIKHFLDDVAEGEYKGFGRLGLSFAKLESPTLRQWAKAGDADQGVLITEVSAQSPFAATLRAGDILLKVGDTPVNHSGYVRRKRWGWVDVTDLVVDFYPGDDVALDVARDGKTMTVTAKLGRFLPTDDYIHHYRFADEPYLIFGGLVFQELTKGYLESWGSEWAQRAPVELLYVWENLNAPRADRKEKVIILSRVLADRFNHGFDRLGDLVVDTVNGRKIKGMADLRAALKQPVRSPVNPKAGPLAMITFRWDDVKVILPYGPLDDASKRIAKTYGVPHGEVFALAN